MRIIWFAALGVLGYFAAGAGNQPTLVKADGSSTVFPITEAVAEEFRKVSPEIRVTVGISGTGGGFKKFCSGETDIADASRPIKPSEVELCLGKQIGYVELPVAFDGIVIVVHPRNTWAEHITRDELKRLWEPEAQRQVKRWSDIRPGWPDKEIHLFGAGVDSGTYDYFTEAVVGKEHSSRGDYTSSEDDNVLVQGVAGDELALGFFGFAYFDENRDRLKALPVDDGKAENGEGPIAPSIESIRTGTYQPLSRPIFIYASVKSLNRPEVEKFVQFYLDSAQELVQEVGYIPLPEQAYALATERMKARRSGSMFEGKGSQVGVSIETLMQKEQVETPN